MVMRTMRNNIAILQWMFVLLLIVFGLGLVLPSGNRDLATAAAIVDGAPVDGQRYSRIVQSSLDSQRQAQGGELSDGQSAEVRQTVLNGLIEEQLALAHADALGQKTSVEEFRQMVLNDPNFRDDKGNYDPTRYEQLLNQQAQQQGMDWKQAEANFQRSILLQKVRGFFNDQALLNPAEQAQAEAKFNRQVKVQAAVWDLARLKAVQPPTEEDVHAYYSENKQKWAKPAQVKLRQILVKTDFAMATATAEAKANSLLAKLKAGADFKTLAKAENTDTASKDNGGDLGWIGRDDLRDPLLASAAMRLKTGQLSDVIKTTEGYHILKAEDTKAGFEPTLENSKAKAKDELSTQRASRLAGEYAFQALNEVKKGSTLEAAAKAHQGAVVTAGWFGRDSEQALPALGKAPQFAQECLNLDKGEAPQSPTITDKATAFAIIIDEKAGPAPAKAEAAASRKREALALARNQKSNDLYKGWIKSLRDKAKIKDQVGALPETASK
jgi:peptidyl-prolyl cis-trans isomerase D